VEIHAGRDAVDPADDVGDMGSMAAVAVDEAGDVGVDVLPAAIDRVRVGRKAAERPHFTHEVEAADDVRVGADRIPVGRDLVRLVGGVLSIGGVVGLGRAGATERCVGVVDAAVEDGDAHAASVEAGILVDRRGTDVGNGVLEVVGVIDDRRN
jgi:hypothetical protein